MDALQNQSAPFRLGLPVAYILYAGTQAVTWGYLPFTKDSYPDTVVNITGNRFTHGRPVVVTDLGILVNITVTILILMASYLYALLRGGTDRVCFPIRVNLFRSDVPLVVVASGAVDLSTAMGEARELTVEVMRLQAWKARHARKQITRLPTFNLRMNHTNVADMSDDDAMMAGRF
jgi:hypothetical protein